LEGEGGYFGNSLLPSGLNLVGDFFFSFDFFFLVIPHAEYHHKKNILNVKKKIKMLGFILYNGTSR
jgi:hypothetical protein